MFDVNASAIQLRRAERRRSSIKDVPKDPITPTPLDTPLVRSVLASFNGLSLFAEQRQGHGTSLDLGAPAEESSLFKSAD